VPKRIVLLLDGTWNDIDVGPYDTNIVRMRDLISRHLVRISGRTRHDEGNKKVHGYTKAGKEHIIYYERGVGTGAFDRFKGGVFGEGLPRNIRHAYKFLSFWYEPGDEIFIYGFSRGAYTARSLVGYLGAAGLLRRDNCNEELEALAWRYYRTPPNDRMPADWRRLTDNVHDRNEVRVKLIGVFDTVGALGIPFSKAWRLNRDENGFHDVQLSSITDVNLHALAIDEHRWPFEAALWRMPPFKKYDTAVEQVWFSGAHADVGGGYIVEESRDGKAAYADDITLDWMIRRTKHFYPDFPFDLDPNAEKIAARERASLHNSRRNVYRVWPFAIRSIANCKTGANRWRRQAEVSRDRHARPIGEMVHISALERFLPERSVGPTGDKYEAANLDKVIAWIKETYEHRLGDEDALARSESGGSMSIFELPVVDWNGQTITSRCSRAEYLRGLLAKRAEHGQPDSGLGSLFQAIEAKWPFVRLRAERRA
jgi:Uncharacterized alpha/beta hydrolase domain (DUF2235)